MAAFLFMLKGKNIILRACEPSDLEMLYGWENDVSVWNVTNTYIPYSRYTLQKYLDSVQDIYSDKQLRLVIENETGPVGMIDLFDYEPFHQRAGVGILVAKPADRGQGIGTDAIETLKTYCRDQLGLRILFCNILATNAPSISLFERSGFVKCGVKPGWHKQDNAYVDEWFYQISL